MQKANRIAVSLVTVMLVAGASHAHADDSQISSMQQLLSDGYNTYVSGNMGTSGNAYLSDSQAPIAVGGNVVLQGFGASTNSTANGVGLTVGGSLSMTNGSVNGATDVAGSVSATSVGFGNVNAGGSLSYQNGQISGNVNVDGNASFSGAGITGQVAVGGTASFVNAATPTVTAATAYAAPINFTAVNNSVAATSTALAALSATAGDSLTRNAQGQYVFTSTVAGDNVFNLTSAQLAALSSNQVVFNSTVAGATDIVNVTNSGTVALPSNMSFSYAGTMTDNKVLLNLSNASTVDAASNVSYDLSILAPNATVVTSGGNITGSLFAANLTGNAQLNLSNAGTTFAGALSTAAAAQPAPMPALGATPIGMLGLGWFAWRSRRQRSGRTPALAALAH